MRTEQYPENIAYHAKSVHGTDGYDDSKSIRGFQNLLLAKTDEGQILRQYIREYANLDSNFSYRFKDHPYGKYDVDSAIFCLEKKEYVCNIEFTTYRDWDPLWPVHYKWFTALKRKEKYWILKPDMPYISCIMNMQHDKFITATKEDFVQYPYTTHNLGKVGSSVIRKIPLSVCRKFGDWDEDELLMVS